MVVEEENGHFGAVRGDFVTGWATRVMGAWRGRWAQVDPETDARKQTGGAVNLQLAEWGDVCWGWIAGVYVLGRGLLESNKSLGKCPGVLEGRQNE